MHSLLVNIFCLGLVVLRIMSAKRSGEQAYSPKILHAFNYPLAEREVALYSVADGKKRRESEEVRRW